MAGDAHEKAGGDPGVRGRGRVALLVAFHFPPCQGSSGLQRPLSLVKHLPASGWSPVVLSAHRRAYPRTDDRLLAQVPPRVPVHRAAAFDVARHLSIGGRYPGWIALPDRWTSWLAAAVPAGLRLVRRHRPGVLWSTYPIATSHLVGLALHRLTGIPWVADFRDPMTEGELGAADQFPADAALWRVRRRIERAVMRHASRFVCVAPGALQMYRERYATPAAPRWALIPNGFDEASFEEAERLAPRRPAAAGGPLRLLHSGLLYAGAGDRNPAPFFAALSELRHAGVIDAARLQVTLRATGHDELYRTLLREAALEDIVTLAPAIPYTEALAEMLRADGLLLFQGADSNRNIPAKLYEYLRAGRPIFAMTDERGDTAGVLREAGAGTIVPLSSATAIAAGLGRFLDAVRAGSAPVAPPQVVRGYSREARARELAHLFDEVATEARS